MTYTIATDAIFINNRSALPTIVCMAAETGSGGLTGFGRYDRNFLPLRLSRYSKYDDEVPSRSSELLLLRFSFGFFPLDTVCLKGIEGLSCIARFLAANFLDPRIIVIGVVRIAVCANPTLNPSTIALQAKQSNKIIRKDHVDFMLLNTVIAMNFARECSLGA